MMGIFDFLDRGMRETNRTIKKMERQQTQMMIRSAKRSVALGDRVLKDAQNNMWNARRDADAAISNYASLCQETSRKLGEEVQPTIQRFNDFNIDARISAPNVGSGSLAIPSLDIPTGSFAGGLLGMGMSGMNPLGGLLDTFLGKYQFNKAQEQLEAANEYSSEALAASAKMNTAADRMKMIKQELDSNGVQIRELTDKVVSISTQLRDAMSQSSFTSEMAEHLKNISKIASMICKHLSTTFLNEDATINQTFKNQSETMEKINSAIPSAPSISDQRLLFALRDVINSTGYILS